MLRLKLRTKSIITISKTDLDKVNNNYNEQLNRELSELKKERIELNKRIRKFSDSLKRTVLKIQFREQ